MTETNARRGDWLVLAAALAIGVATLTPSGDTESSSSLCVICGEVGGVDAALNVLLFVPLGLGLSQLRLRAPVALAIVLAATLSIETLQILVVPGRDASVGDVIMNSAGGLLGFWLGRNASLLLRPGRTSAARLSLAWLALWLGVQAFIAYSFVPVLPGAPYYGQVTRPATPWRSAFPGKVLAASVGPEALRAGPLGNAARVREQLARPEGTPAEVVAIPSGSVAGRAEIVVISGPEMVGVLSFEQEGENLIFGERTGAERLRLRPYEYRLGDAFSPSTTGDTMLLRGTYTPSLVVVGAASSGEDRERRFVPRLSQGWILLSPVFSYIDDDGPERLASVAFLVLLILPAGYWSGLAARPAEESPGRLRNAWLLGALAVVLGVGLGIVPSVFAMRSAAVWEWISVILGAALGAVIARWTSPAQSDLAHGQPVRSGDRLHESHR